MILEKVQGFTEEALHAFPEVPVVIGDITCVLEQIQMVAEEDPQILEE